MENKIAPEGHVYIDTIKYKRFLPNVVEKEHLVRIQSKEMWDRQIERENKKLINNAKARKTKSKVKTNYKKNRNSLLESEKWRKERYHKSVWKNTDSGNITQAGPVTTTKRDES